MSPLRLKERYRQITALYRSQVNLSHRTSHSILFQQYSTPFAINEKDLHRWLPSWRKRKITKDDPYGDKVRAIQKALKQRDSREVKITKAELNGLEGIVKACGCGVHVTAAKQSRLVDRQAAKGTKPSSQIRHQSLNGVLTAEEMANRQLDLLNLVRSGIRCSVTRQETSR